MSRSRSNKKAKKQQQRPRSFQRIAKGSAKGDQASQASFSKSQSQSMIYHQGGIIIGNGALMSQHNRSPREMSQEAATAVANQRSNKKSRANSQKSLTNIQLNMKNMKKLNSTQGEDDVTT